jgi:hypothetical protein
VENAHGFINELVVDLLCRREGEAVAIATDATWGWKASYVTGALMAERIHGFLGVEGPLSPEELAAIAGSARRLVGDGWWTWVPEAFISGYRDLEEAGTTPEAITAFLKSRPMSVLPAEFRLFCHALDRRGRVPVPMAFFAGGRGARRPDGALG